jgi:hypothetical protein
MGICVGSNPGIEVSPAPATTNEPYGTIEAGSFSGGKSIEKLALNPTHFNFTAIAYHGDCKYSP